MAETIKEFLVSLGYQVDGASETKFKNSVATATKGAVALGLSLTAAATAVSAAVTKIAAGFDEMFFMSQRAGASVQNIKGLSYAVSQLGGSYQGALASIENFAQKLRSNPGYESLVKSLGVATRENGRLRETTAIVQDLAKVLSKKPQYVALQYLEALGIDERTYNAMKSGDLTRFMDEYAAKARALGVDQKQAAEIGNQLTQAWRSLGATAELIGAKLEQTLGRSLASFVKDIDDFLLRNADKIVAFFNELGKASAFLAAAFTKLIEALTPAWKEFDKIAQSLTGQSGLQVALEAFAVWLVGSWLLRVLGAFTAVGTGWTAMLLRLGISPLGAVAGIAGGAYALNESDKDFNRRREAIERPGGRNPFAAIDGPTPKDERNWWQRTMPSWLGGKEAPKPTGWSGPPGGARGIAGAQEAYAFWRSKGLTHEQATGVVANEQAESNHNPMARGDGGRAHGLYQHHPDRRANILAGTGIDMSTASANQQRQGAYWEMTSGKERATWRALQNAKTAAEAAAIVTQMYERPADKAGESYKRGAIAERLARVLRLPEPGAAVPPASNIIDMLRKSPNVPILDRISGNAALVGGGASQPAGAPLMPAAANNNTSVDMQQKTEITILGGSDPSATAAAVSDAQKGVNGTMLRNMAGAVR